MLAWFLATGVAYALAAKTSWVETAWESKGLAVTYDVVFASHASLSLIAARQVGRSSPPRAHPCWTHSPLPMPRRTAPLAHPRYRATRPSSCPGSPPYWPNSARTNTGGGRKGGRARTASSGHDPPREDETNRVAGQAKCWRVFPSYARR